MLQQAFQPVTADNSTVCESEKPQQDTKACKETRQLLEAASVLVSLTPGSVLDLNAADDAELTELDQQRTLALQVDSASSSRCSSSLSYVTDDAFESATEDRSATATPVVPPCLEDLDEEGKATLFARILKQVDFYFGDASFPKDRFLLKHCRQDPEGYISLETVARFKKMKKIVADWTYIVPAVAKSEVVKLNHAKTMIKRRNPVPRDPEDALTRTVVLENIPKDVTETWCRETCAPHGRLAQVRIIRPIDSLPDDVRKYCTSDDDSKEVHPALRSSKAVCALVEFEYKDQANKAVEAVNKEGAWRKGGVKFSILYRKPKSKSEGEKKRRRRRRQRKEGGSTDDEQSREQSRASSPWVRSRTSSNASDAREARSRCNSSASDNWRNRGGRSNTNSPSPNRPDNKSPTSRLLHPRGGPKSRTSPLRAESPSWRAEGRSVTASPVPRSASPFLRSPNGPDGSSGFGCGRGKALKPCSPVS